MARPVGSKNTKTEQWEKFSVWFVTQGMERLQKEMEQLEGKDYVTTVRDMLEYFKPKLARTELTGKDGKDLNINVLKYGGNNTPQLPAKAVPVAATGSD